jgi:hypothetical protein
MYGWFGGFEFLSDFLIIFLDLLQVHRNLQNLCSQNLLSFDLCLSFGDCSDPLCSAENLRYLTSILDPPTAANESFRANLHIIEA